MAHLANFSISLRVLSRLLSYPDSAVRDDLDDMRAALQAERALTPARKEELHSLIHHLKTGNPLESESQYVELFDRGRSTSLHLFEHVHGDSRDRGPAMIDLLQTYEKAGLLLAPGELPDYLPALLEFVSTQPSAEARSFLSEMSHIFSVIFSALQKRRSPYASALGALLELAGERAQAVAVVPDEPIDTAWEEPVVFDGCSSKGQGKSTSSDQPQPIHFVRTEASSQNAKVSAHSGVSL
jgi:nitrate reductase delta subunit